jgi:hypothetical protein
MVRDPPAAAATYTTGPVSASLLLLLLSRWLLVPSLLMAHKIVGPLRWG